LQQRSVQVTSAVSPCPPVSGDPFLLQLALSNLLENALAFSPDGSSMEAAITVEEGGLTFSLRDHGSGIPDYALPQIYDRFYSLPRPEGASRSSGLGLPLVREIAKLHGGRIRIANHPDGGVLASLDLPLA
ncbi:MAG TPA: ATP-binding protein, partial [Moraxellaceae bacterium]